MGTQGEKKNATKVTSSRGRRRLDFKRFQGKSLFLDLPGYRQVARLEEELTARGATLETQFHSGVKYLITKTRNEEGKNPSQSPSTPSPNTPGTAKSSLSQLLSPATDLSPSEVTPRQGIVTRAQQMVQLSRGRGGRKADLRTLARQWGCKVVTLDELLAELKKLKPLPSATSKSCDEDSQHKIRTLRGPFLKVEDLSQAYRPLVLEMRRWPRPLCHTSHKVSPFDPPHMTKSLEDARDTPHGLRHTHKQGGGGKDRVEVKEKRPGHCECCSVKFEDLHMHLRSARHQEYASNEENFRSLDQLIAQGKSFSQFISELKSTPPHSTCNGQPPPTYTPPPSASVVSSHIDSVVLVTLPTSHATPTRRRSPRQHPSTPPKQHQSHTTPKKHTVTPTKSPLTDSRSTPTNRKRKPAEATPTIDTTTPPVFEATPTKKLRFSSSPEASAPTKRPRSHTPSSSTPRGSPAQKRTRASSSPLTVMEGVRRSPRLLMKQLVSASPPSN